MRELLGDCDYDEEVELLILPDVGDGDGVGDGQGVGRV
jgi:hypothetical protein